MKKKILYLDLPFHKKTKSSLFVLDLLEQYYEVDVYYYESTLNIIREMYQIVNVEYDFLVCWQVMPEDYVLSHIHYRRGVFFPMYDNVVNMMEEVWERFRGFLIISFSYTLYRYLLDRDFSVKYIQYFPQPDRRIQDWGSTGSLFFWQRVNHIDVNYVLGMCGGLRLEKVYLHKALDPGHEFKKIECNDKYKINYSCWFKDKTDMLDVMRKAAYYAAPRKYEGIGMGFLEAMALGRCVICPDYPTMNEYITDGVNGLLYQYESPRLLTEFDVRKIQKNAFEFVSEGYLQWMQKKSCIVEWMENSDYYKADKKETIIIKERSKGEKKFKLYFELLNQWLMLKNQGIKLADFFKDRKIEKIAVYGGGEMGRRLVEELEGTSVRVVGIIDRKPEQVTIPLPIYGIYDKVKTAEAIVVTPVISFGEIFVQLAGIYDCSIFSLGEIINFFIT